MEGTKETARDDLRMVRDREVPGSHPGPLTMTRGVISRLRAGVAEGAVGVDRSALAYGRRERLRADQVPRRRREPGLVPRGAAGRLPRPPQRALHPGPPAVRVYNDLLDEVRDATSQRTRGLAFGTCGPCAE